MLLTGNVPGMDASKAETHELTGEPKDTSDPENNFDLDAICAWISRPTTLFHLEIIKEKVITCLRNGGLDQIHHFCGRTDVEYRRN